MSRKMKDSRVEWIGLIPEEWNIVKVKRKFKYSKEIVGEKEKDFERLALTLKGVIKRPKNDSEGLQPEKFESYQIIRKNDLVFKLIDLENVRTSRVGLSPYEGIVSPAYIKLTNPKESRFGYYFFITLWYHEVFNNIGGNGVRSNLTSNDLLNLPYIDVPYNEQQKIANFLDEKVSQIDTIIEKTKQSIEELKKYKQSLIAETVTKGLDPNVEMKDSGIEWVGEIPKHWEIRRLRDISIITRGTVDKSKKKNEIPVYLVQYTNVYYKREQKINDDDYLPITVSENEYKKYKVRKGDILLTASSETKDDIGHSTVIVEDLPNHVFGSDIIRIRIPNKIVDLNYKKYFMENYYYLAKFDKLSRGITRFRFGMDQFKSLKYVIPPIEEQVKIAKYLDNITNHINQLICNKEKLINELESYKKSLIYEYVTGKKEVM